MDRKKGVRATVLVEDRALGRFSREVLKLLGFGSREIRIAPFPAGKGSAKQWVEQQYPAEVRAHRGKAKSQKIALLVGTEADQQTVKYRFDSLALKLKGAGWPDRRKDERIAIWVPKWHLETWFLHLAGEKVDENSKCKRRAKGLEPSDAAEAFVDCYRGSRQALPSLKIAFEETDRLDL